MERTNVSCLKANFIMVTVTCIIAYIVWLFLYPCGKWNKLKLKYKL